MTSLSLALLSIASAGAAPNNVLLDFHAKWCGPCQQMSSVVSRLQRQGYAIRKVDVDEEPNLTQQFGVRTIPAFVLVINGQEADRVEGVTSEGDLKRMLAQIPQSEMAIVSSTGSASAPRSSAPASTPSVKLAQHEAEPKAGFQFPFLGGKKRDKQPAPVVLNENATIRANPYDEQPETPAAPGDKTLATSTRIRVKDDRGINFGSGTIIESRTGRSVVLTCGHIFRDLPQGAAIEVDVFLGNRFETFLGEVIDFDAEGDVGLIAIPTADPLPVSRIAAAETLLSTSDRVFSIGCGGGEVPSKESLVVTALNRYEGPHNIECTGVPQQGRSGGGLFGQGGDVIGVCIAADPKEQRGLYAGFQAIHSLLDRTGLAYLYRGGSPESQGHEFARTDAQNQDPAFAQMRDPAGAAAGLTPTNHEGRPPVGSVSPQPRPQASGVADLDGLAESEVICIIRPRNQSEAASRVIVINRASPKFMSYLTNELHQQPHTTTASVPLDEPMPGAQSQPRPAAQRLSRSALVGGATAGSGNAAEQFQRYRRSVATK